MTRAVAGFAAFPGRNDHGPVLLVEDHARTEGRIAPQESDHLVVGWPAEEGVVGRVDRYSGNVALDDFTVTAPPVVGVKESFDAIEMLKKVRSGTYQPANGASYPAGSFGRNLKQIAQLIKANVGLQIAFAEVDGWDTHANQGAAKGQLSGRLGTFAQALAALHQDLGDRMADVVVVTMSEFGRAVHQNGNRGTDHGHGTCFFALGGSIKGGKVYGDWPTLAPDKLFQKRDLDITTDYRDVFGEICARHFDVPMAEMAKIFPNYGMDAKRFRNFCTA